MMSWYQHLTGGLIVTKICGFRHLKRKGSLFSDTTFLLTQL